MSIVELNKKSAIDGVSGGEGKKSGESIVILASGTGLKDVPAAQEKIEIPKAQSKSLEGFLTFYNKNKRK